MNPRRVRYRTNVGLANFTPAFNLGLYFTGDVRDCAVEDLAPPALAILGDNPMNLECGSAFVDPRIPRPRMIATVR